MTVQVAKEYQQSFPTGITNVAVTDSPQFVLPTAGYDKLSIQIVYTWDSATELQIVPECSLDGQNFGPYYSTAIAIVGAVTQGTNTPYVDLVPVTGSAVIPLTYIVNSFKYMRFTVTGTGATVDDIVTITSNLSTGPSL